MSQTINYLNTVSSFSTSDIKNQNELNQTVSSLSDTTNTIRDLTSNIKMNEQQAELLKNELDTRNRMLQVSIEKNIYKRKIVFTLIALILLLLTLMGAGFFYLQS